MERIVQGRRGGILELLEVVADFEEFITYDLLSLGHSLDELGHSLSWWDLKVVLRQHPGRYAQELQRRREIEAAPVEERTVGGKADALSIDEMNTFLGWD
jgi:hypothetical protein